MAANVEKYTVTQLSVQQAANYVYLDTSVNIAIGKQAPSKYFKTALKQVKGELPADENKIGTLSSESDFWRNLEVNGVPRVIVDMTSDDYSRFLQERRRLMARKIKDYYYAL